MDEAILGEPLLCFFLTACMFGITALSNQTAPSNLNGHGAIRESVDEPQHTRQDHVPNG